MNNKIVLGFSGGMDSAYTALLLKEQGFDVIAVNLVMHSSCDFSDAAIYTASKVNIPIKIINARDVFEEKVILPFSNQYVNGFTPNPCISCNPNVKFKLLFDVADEVGADFVATGHYVNKIVHNDRVTFSPAKDLRKDQAYFLYRLTQSFLHRLIFPLANIEKQTIKNFFDAEMPSALSSNKESYDICFIADKSYESIVSAYAPLPPEGNIIDDCGNIIGKHKGIHAYTIGQRKGLGVALGKPAFVSKIDAVENSITLSFAGCCEIDKFIVKDCCYLLKDRVEIGDKYYVKVRYNAKPVQCIVDDIYDDCVIIRFEEHQKPVAKGQSAVFYDDNGLMVFGGVIS